MFLNYNRNFSTKQGLGVFVAIYVRFISYQYVKDEFEESLKLLREMHGHAPTHQWGMETDCGQQLRRILYIQIT